MKFAPIYSSRSVLPLRSRHRRSYRTLAGTVASALLSLWRVG